MNEIRKEVDYILGKISSAEMVVEELQDELLAVRAKCSHERTTWHGGDKWCDDCDAIVN